MTDRPWKKLVEDLTRRGHESPHLERLRQRLPVPAGLSGYRELEIELAQEMASSLGRAGEKVDVALLELEVLGQAVDEATTRGDAAARAAAVRAFNDKREHALKALWELKVHREAIGLRRHDMLAQYYVVPKPRT